jgi:MFS family permease
VAAIVFSINVHRYNDSGISSYNAGYSMAQQQQGNGINWQQAVAAFSYRNYRLWFIGQCVSLFGTWMQSTAQQYFIFQLTGSSKYLGYLSFASGLPAWLFMLYAGIVADRVPRRTILVLTQTWMMILAFILAGLTLTGVVQPWHILVLAVFLGLANAFEAPARLSFVMELVEREDLTNAIALNSAMFNLAMAVGPAVSGVVYAAVGPAWCFTINGISFLAVIAALLLMRLKVEESVGPRLSAFTDLKEGFRYAITQPLVRTLLLFTPIMTIFGFAFVTLFPAWAVNVLWGNATTNGLLQSSRGLGALISSLGIAALGRFKFKGKLLTFGTFIFPCALLLYASAWQLPRSLLMLMVMGGALILVMNLTNSLIQNTVPDRLRGRVMSIYSFNFFGTMPIGGLLAGVAAAHVGEPLTLSASALILLGMSTLVYLIVPQLRTAE